MLSLTCIGKESLQEYINYFIHFDSAVPTHRGNLESVCTRYITVFTIMAHTRELFTKLKVSTTHHRVHTQGNFEKFPQILYTLQHKPYTV